MITDIQYKEAIADISKEVMRLGELPAREETKVLKQIGETVKGNVKAIAKRSKKVYTNKGGHIKDDVVYKVKTKKGSKYVSISGGSKTWRKWHLVNDGHVALNGTYVRGDKFADRAALASEDDINSIVDSMCRTIVNGE